jgi:hypothetical protein
MVDAILWPVLRSRVVHQRGINDEATLNVGEQLSTTQSDGMWFSAFFVTWRCPVLWQEPCQPGPPRRGRRPRAVWQGAAGCGASEGGYAHVPCAGASREPVSARPAAPAACILSDTGCIQVELAEAEGVEQALDAHIELAGAGHSVYNSNTPAL